MEVFGFDEVAQDMDILDAKSSQAKVAMHDIGDKMTDRAKSNFKAVLTQRTGQGASGIQNEKTDDDVVIGWSARPGLHGYFHEIGTYKDPPKPHLRPAFDEMENDFVRQVQEAIT